MYLFIGNKNEIGVEFIFDKLLIRNSYYGYGKIWFGGNFLGSIEDSIYFDGYLLSQLQDILKCEEINLHDLPSDLESKFNYFQAIEDDDKSNLFYKIYTTTFTDIYRIFAYKNKNVITIIWKVTWHDTFDNVKTQGREIFTYQFEEEKLIHIFRVLDDIQKIEGLHL